MGMTCMLQSLNMLTDGLNTLRTIQPNVFYSIRVEMLRVPSNPSGAFMIRIAEFVDNLEILAFHEKAFQILAGTNLSVVQVFDAKSLQQVLIGENDIAISKLLFYSCMVDHIPPTIGNLPLLTELTFSRCSIRNISLNVFRKNLRLAFLDLSYNEIETIMPISSADGEIPLAIEDLYLASNRLQNLDFAAFASLSNLATIDLRNNNLIKLEAGRPITLSNMVMLDIGDNQLSTIDLQWLSAPNLQRLVLNNNLLDKIPQRLRRFSNLRLVALSNNKFTGIDLAPLNGLPMLNSIDVSNNPARYIRSSRPVRLPMLDTLYAEFCTLSRFNTTGMDFPVVTFISLAHNNFSTIPPLGQSFPTVEAFSLFNNPISCNVLKARTDMILSGKLIMGPPQDPSDCPIGSTKIVDSFLLCCKA
ncbi:P-granule-associated novel protein 1-like [Anopheles funestus]|uniref:P-granule-associated novel protein 1-like n=1 Tax=Anopheles funestus TaxID=62324 RepID=UPI0020C721DA|nr:P-granule-associated novel protein 1-like [Anopheles funestus]